MDNTNTNTESRPVSGCTGLQFRAVGKIIVTQGQNEGLTIQADPEIRSRIRTEVKDGILVISYDSDWKDWTGLNFIDKGVTTFHLTLKDIKSLSISGVGNLDSASIISDSLSLSLSGPATMTFGTLTVNSLKVEMSGVGSIDLAGKCLEQNISLSGAGGYKASRLESDRAIVKLSGVGSATVLVSESLDVSISGAGAVEYYGNPKISQKISGIGVLKYLGTR
ncbi:MAG: hypothetical protein ACD_34C00017G0002 [uncultured bacterium]|nr:MAG: hypothetical protein ACD_34C00017G0002 [uncultured bacterium]HCS40681.1 hypothetical protein [Anaerolineaceae bacterium]